jgi:hypothetical protein
MLTMKESNSGLAHRLGQQARLFDGVGDGLLQVDVLARLERIHGHLEVPMFGSADKNRVHILAREQVVVAVMDLLRFELQEIPRPGHAPRINVAEGDHLDVAGLLLEGRHKIGGEMPESDVSDSDHTDLNAVVRSKNARCGRSRQRQRSRFEKRPPGIAG